MTSGIASHDGRPALLPSPHILRLISTISVHPILTTRAKSADTLQAANLAHRYLRQVLKTVGPVQSGFADAFDYGGGTSPRSTRRGGVRRRVTGSSPPKHDTFGLVENELATGEALFAQVGSFWDVVGWAFNCSVLHEPRWERWCLWLEFMVEVLETEWEMKLMQKEEMKSMIVAYILAGRGALDGGRDILRAIFADGQKFSAGRYQEIWKNETRQTRQDTDTKKFKKIDIEADDYGDYVSDESDDDLASIDEAMSDEPVQSASPSKAAMGVDSQIPEASLQYGGIQALALRFRLLALLSKASQLYSAAFTDSSHPSALAGATQRLFMLILEYIRPLPLPSFFVMVSQSTLSHLDPGSASVLIQYLLHKTGLIASKAPEPVCDFLQQDRLEESFLPWTAKSTSIEDNAKVSLCVETLMRLLHVHTEGLVWTKELEQAVEGGIKARETKAQGKQVQKRGRKGKAKNDGKDDEADLRTWMRDSAARMRLFLLTLKTSTQDGERVDCMDSTSQKE